MQKTKIRATHSGVILDHLDCYVLEDGRRVVSQRGVVRLLSSDATGSAPLGRFVGRLPKQYGHLATQPVLTFARPDGGVAKGREALWVVDLLRAYDEADDLDLLHTQQRPLAKNARKVLRALAGVGLESLIDEATGYQAERAADAMQVRLDAILGEGLCPWDRMWSAPVVDPIARLHGQRYVGGTQPRWLASTYAKIYRLILGEDVVAELKRRNPEPEFGANHHQWLTPAARRTLRRQLDRVSAIAATSSTTREFWAKLEHLFLGHKLQLTFA